MSNSKLGISLAFAVVFLAASAFAAQNLPVNGNFSAGLSGWRYSDNVSTATDFWGFASPSGDGSPFGVLLSDNNVFNPYLRQQLDPPAGDLMLKFDVTFVIQEASYSDDFRAQINVSYPGGGGSNPIFSKGTGDGDWVSTGTGLRYFSLSDFTYDLSGWQGTDDIVLQFSVVGCNADSGRSAAMIDDVRIEALGAVPEPATVILLTAGLGLMAHRLRRRKEV